MNTHVDFETAKSLKEKGFDIAVSCYYNNHPPKNGHPRGLIKGIATHGVIQDHNGETEGDDLICSAPTISETIMWLYEKHGIWIEVSCWTNQPVGGELWKNCFQAFVNGDAMNVFIFKTPTEAYSEAIAYSLKNLI